MASEGDDRRGRSPSSNYDKAWIMNIISLIDEEFSRKARDRLSGALSSAIDRVEPAAADLLDGLPDLTAGLESPLKRIIKWVKNCLRRLDIIESVYYSSSSPWSSPIKSPRSTRRRRKKDPPKETAFHHTFVLKLFDRSVDLAQFEANTALYPVCRAWMKDQPHNKNFAPRLRTPTPEPLLDSDSAEEDNPEEAIENGVDGEAAPKKRKVDDSVYKLPAFEPRGESSLRVPEPLVKPGLKNFTMEEVTTASSFIFIHLHLHSLSRSRWKILPTCS